MEKRPELPSFSNNPQNKPQQNDEQHHQIIWEDRDDVYRPAPKSLEEFKQKRDISDGFSRQVYIKSSALEALKKHLKSNTRVEQGGILYGHAYQEPSSAKIYVEITAAIAAPATIGSGAHLEFTSNSWIGIMDYAKAKHPEENIVGWYHSHPNLGVFMSGTDMRTQRAFFNHPWCLSIVYDPVREDIGYFLGKDAKNVEPFIYDISANSSTINWREIADNTQPTKDEQPLAIISLVQQPVKLERSKSDIPVWVFSIPLSFLVGFWVANNFINTSQTEPTDTNLRTSSIIPTFQAYLKDIPIKEFKAMNEVNPHYLRYFLSNQDNKITQGLMVKGLILQKNGGTESIHDLTLKYDKIKLSSEQEIKDNSSIFLSKISEKIESKSMPLKFQSSHTDEVIFFMYGYSPKTNSQKIHERDTIYIPRSITYLDNNKKKIEINVQNYVRGEYDKL